MGLWDRVGARGSNNDRVWPDDLPSRCGGALHACGVRLLCCLRRLAGCTMKSRKQRLLGRCHPPAAQHTAHNVYDVVMAQHTQCIWGGACAGMLRVCAR
jgi:hypothetical protein